MVRKKVVFRFSFFVRKGLATLVPAHVRVYHFLAEIDFLRK